MIEQVYDRTGGVPLFVEEFTKMVQESGSLARDARAGTPAAVLPAHEIPATLQDLINARLDRMEGEQEVAQLAATLGREFSHELMAAVASWTKRTSMSNSTNWCGRKSCSRKAGRRGARTFSSTHCLKMPCTTRW